MASAETATSGTEPKTAPGGFPIVVRRWFGKSGRCLDTERLCRPYVQEVYTEQCFYVQGHVISLTPECQIQNFAANRCDNQSKIKFLRQLLGDGYAGVEESRELAKDKSALQLNYARDQFTVEIGPKLRHKTPWCTNVLSICASTGVILDRIERTTRYLITMNSNYPSLLHRDAVKHLLYDNVLEMVYDSPIIKFADDGGPPKFPRTWDIVPVIASGVKILEQVNLEYEFGFDACDMDYYNHLFRFVLKRNPTMVELFDLAQSNSEHSRHWFFQGNYQLDGKELDKSLMDMVKETNGSTTNNNNVIKFHDNSSAIMGHTVPVIKASNPVQSSQLIVKPRLKHLLLTAETHNFPTGVEPFSGAATGTGGRIRDVMAAGRGGTVVAGAAGYCVGQLHLPNYKMPWESEANYNGFFQRPEKIIIDASNGASDYGNKFGEPVIAGFFRAYGGKVDEERREWLKPIMFTSGIGLLDDEHVNKTPIRVEDDIQIAKIGGPAYRIGIGGGSASSVMHQGAATDRTLQAVQRGDPEMGNKLNKLLRACIELEDENPILSIHDQGAGGNANVLKEIVDGHGADIYANKFTLGDNSMNLKELWTAEYQESNAILFKKSDENLLQKISEREKCNIDVVGEVVHSDTFRLIHVDRSEAHKGKTPVNFPLRTVQGEMPMKKYKWTSSRAKPAPLELLAVDFVETAHLILKLPSVASKRFLTSKVDRSVGGLIAQQQCVGPLQLPLADVAVTASSYFSKKGTATTIGEQPIITLVNPAAGARMSLMEALASMVMAPVSSLKDIKCSVNWMWPAKLPGEGYAMYEACEGLCELMKTLGVAADGGKDSLSMAAQTVKQDGDPERIIKSPGTVVVSAYAPCEDISKVVTPDIKGPLRGLSSVLLLVRPVDVVKARLGGSAFAQVHAALGVTAPDFTADDADIFCTAFDAIQRLIEERKILACHDVSEGGLFVCLLEMCMAGCSGANVSFDIDEAHTDAQNGSCLPDQVSNLMATLFSEEIAWLIEVEKHLCDEVMTELQKCKISNIGSPTNDTKIIIRGSQQIYYEASIEDVRELWEETSYRLELNQTDSACASEEYEAFKRHTTPLPYRVNFDYKAQPENICEWVSQQSPRVAVIREEGTNGDREMAAAFIMAGFRVDDLTTSDIVSNASDLRDYQGLVFPGGFSFADCLGAAVGWAAKIRGTEYLRNILAEWRDMPHTFSLAVCNGCQLTSLLGWQDLYSSSLYAQREVPAIKYAVNNSNRFESRWSRVVIPNNNSFMLKDMEDSVLGVWVAHKEGKFTCDDQTLTAMREEKLIALQYVDYHNNVTQMYPHNPNGSKEGVAGVVSRCGRHLAMMPHPERCFLPWQWPDHGSDKSALNFPGEDICRSAAPWTKMFQNAYDWCISHEHSKI